MAKAYNATCLVIRHTKLGETDTIVTMLSDEGMQIRAVAKGLRKPGNRTGARLQLFSEVKLLLHAGKSLDVVGETETVATNARLREELERTACASVIAELLEKLGRDGARLEPRMYAMASAALRELAELPVERCLVIVDAFLFKSMAMQGLAPATRECALCGSPISRIERFDVGCGGALCASCANDLGMQASAAPDIAAWVDSLLYCTFSELAQADDAPALALLDLAQAWVREHLELNLKSVTFLKTVL